MHMGRTIYIQCYLVIVSKMHLERSYALGWRRSFYLKSQRQIQLRVFSPRSRRNECLHPLGGLNSILRDLTMIENLRTPDFSLHPSPDMKEYNLSKNSGLRLSVFLLRILVSGRRDKHRNRYPHYTLSRLMTHRIHDHSTDFIICCEVVGQIFIQQ